LKKIIAILFVIISVWFFGHAVVITIDGLNDELNYVDVGVVLGNKVELNAQPSKRLQSRLDKAISLYNSQYFEYVIVSGGIGKEGFEEAVVMKEYLMNKGIPHDKIILDSQGINTFMTAKNAKSIMQNMDVEGVMVISQFHHITRTKLAFHTLGLDKVYSAHAEYFEARDIYSVMREFFAYYRYL
jgi:vancomycin permeability regulator SanA